MVDAVHERFNIDLHLAVGAWHDFAQALGSCPTVSVGTSSRRFSAIACLITVISSTSRVAGQRPSIDCGETARRLWDHSAHFGSHTGHRTRPSSTPLRPRATSTRSPARRHKALLESHLADVLRRAGVRRAEQRAQEIWILCEGAMVMMLIHGERRYVLTAARAAKRLLGLKTNA